MFDDQTPFEILASENEAERTDTARWIAKNFAEELAGPSGPQLYLSICRIVRAMDGHVEELNRHVLPLIRDQEGLQEALAQQFRLRIHRATYGQEAGAET